MKEACILSASNAPHGHLLGLRMCTAQSWLHASVSHALLAEVSVIDATALVHLTSGQRCAGRDIREQDIPGGTRDGV